jgi:hypothetical protein
MSTNKQKVLDVAQELGVDVIVNGREVIMESPGRLVFHASGTHGVVASIWDDETMSDQWKKSWEDISLGLGECDQDDCDICEETT